MKNLKVKDLPLLQEFDCVSSDLAIEWAKHYDGGTSPLSRLDSALADHEFFRQTGRRAFMLGVITLLLALAHAGGMTAAGTPFMKIPIIEALNAVGTYLYLAGAAFIFSLIGLVRAPSSIEVTRRAKVFVDDINRLMRAFALVSYGEFFKISMTDLRQRADNNLYFLALSVTEQRERAHEEALVDTDVEKGIQQNITMLSHDYDLFVRFGLITRTDAGFKPYFARAKAHRKGEVVQ